MEYITNLHVTKLDDGGLIIHGRNDIAKDYGKYRHTSGRIESVWCLLKHTGNKKQVPYKYYNWFELDFPLLPHGIDLFYLPVMYAEVDVSIQRAVVTAERHLLIDRVFENWLPANGTNLHEWQFLYKSEKDAFLERFRSQTNFSHYC